jgi:hypothetical protein
MGSEDGQSLHYRPWLRSLPSPLFILLLPRALAEESAGSTSEQSIILITAHMWVSMVDFRVVPPIPCFVLTSVIIVNQEAEQEESTFCRCAQNLQD